MKRLISIILAAVVLCTTMTLFTSADVYSQDSTNANCVHDVIVVHSNHISATQAYHTTEDGTLCSYTIVRLEHTIKCSKCNEIFDKYIANCTEIHSACGGSVECPY